MAHTQRKHSTLCRREKGCMIDVSKDAKEAYKKAIIVFLKERIKTDPLVEEGCKNPQKTLDGCIKYITEQARKQAQNNVACIPDAEVYGWVVHYITEEKPDSIVQQTENLVAEKPIETVKTKKNNKNTTILDELQSEFLF